MPAFEPLSTRFWRKVKQGKADECWEWQGYRQRQGYGVVGFKRSTAKAHRIAYCLEHGLGPVDIDGRDVCHHCDNPACCNPRHLFLGNARVNMLDMVAKGRWGGATGEQHHSSKLTRDDVEAIRRERAAGASCRDLALRFGVTKSTVSKAVLGRTWRHV